MNDIREKLCPFREVTGNYGTGVNFCIGKECAWWITTDGWIKEAEICAIVVIARAML